ncbi:MAG: PD40 domain-containing protein [Chitinophagales bacterium]|nr:PD40 domain-containing protein [Chitinophagales bacterium]
MKRIILIATLLFAFTGGQLHAQYFGRNKPRYNQQPFKVTETEHFVIYDYLDNPEKLKEIAAAAELWYDMHSKVLKDTFTTKNPLIIYNDHAGFQQTNAIMGDISVGTGGVTEGLRNRVVFPVAPTNQQTHHVLGHELVHAFQYNKVLNGDSTTMRNLANIPLWMVEGLAEYLSIGRIDANTSLWMRDAVLNDQVPRLKDLDNGKYFPYRWGQAFWGYITGTYSDEAIEPLFMNTAKYGLQNAVPYTLGISLDSLSNNWRRTLKDHYGRWAIKGKKEDLPGKTLLDDDNAGQMNISPVLSPNGKHVIFLSEKNLFSTDLFLADAKTGKMMRRVYSTTSNGDTDHLNYLESAGTWSPDSKRFAFDAYEKGRSVLIVKDIFKGRKTQKIKIPGVPAFSNPAWSPDGKSIVVSGLVNGQTDLYQYTFKSKKVKKLTNDRYSEIMPTWSADGKSLAFSTDALSIERGRTNGAWTMNLAVMDVASSTVENVDIFPGADNMNPQYDKNGNLFFLSNRDGRRNLYRYDFSNKKVYQLTDLMTGITGVTPYSPAISVADDRDRILYTYYNKGQYIIHQAKDSDFEAKEVDPLSVDQVAAALPPFSPKQKDMVNTGLRLMDSETDKDPQMTAKKFRPKFQLDYLGGSTGVGVNTGNSSFGAQTGLAGGVDALFSDILGNNQLYAGAALNGDIQDAGGQVSYINQKHRIGWGVNASHFAFQSGWYQYYEYVDVNTTSGVIPMLKSTVGLERVFQQRIGGTLFYPFSVTKRVELGTSAEFYSSRTTEYNDYYLLNGGYYGSERKRLPKGGTLNLNNVQAAFVGDNSYFGFTAPLKGWRYRVGVEQYFGGDFNFSSFLADGRRYFYAKPVTFAVRGLSYTRVGGRSTAFSLQYPLFAGNSFFVRGYDQNVYSAPEDSLFIYRTVGSKMLIGNFEIRLPFTGPRQLSLIKSNFLITDLNVFFDAGLSFYELDDLKEGAYIKHIPIFSTGVSMRVNLFGYLVLEPYFALPITAPESQRSWRFGLNFIPGW